jgi:hypothetical protein
MAALNSKFDILRGWPNSSAVQEDFVIPSTANLGTHTFKQGQWVSLLDSNDGVMSCDPTINNVDSSATKSCYLIIEGRDDFSAQFANRVTCLLGGGYIVRLPQKGVDSSGAEYNILSAASTGFTVGQRVKVVDGILNPVDGADIDAAADDVGEINARAAVVGHVLATNDSNNTIDVYVV